MLRSLLTKQKRLSPRYLRGANIRQHAQLRIHLARLEIELCWNLPCCEPNLSFNLRGAKAETWLRKGDHRPPALVWPVKELRYPTSLVRCVIHD
jgi:hypothetical protein